jgi:hypothetical protein
MAYRCPVCDVVQPDGEHLANHLAFTAMLDREDHAEWLDAHAPDFDEMGPEELAAVIAPHVETVDADGDHEQAHEPRPSNGATSPDGPEAGGFEHAIERQAGRGRTAPGTQGGGLDAETQAILEEAQELTAAMLGDEGEAETPDEDEAETSDGEAETPDEDEAETPGEDEGDEAEESP